MSQQIVSSEIVQLLFEAGADVKGIDPQKGAVLCGQRH